MISQYFTAAICPMRRVVRLWLVFPVPADVRDMSENRDHPAAGFACRRFAPVPRLQAARSSRVRPPSAQLQNIAAACCGQARAASIVPSVERIFFASFNLALAPEAQPLTRQFRISVTPGGHGVGVGVLCCALTDNAQTNTLRKTIYDRVMGGLHF